MQRFAQIQLSFSCPRRVVWSGLLMLALLAPVPSMLSAWAEPADAEPGVSKTVALASFDQVWEVVREQYFDYPRIQSDWEAGREQLRPRAAAATDVWTLRGVLSELLALIGESHFVIISAETFGYLDALEDSDLQTRPEIAPEAPRAATGLTLRWIDHAMRVAAVRPGSPAAQAGIQPGWILTAIDGVEIGSAIEGIAALADVDEQRRAIIQSEYGLQYRLSFPPPGEAITIDLVDAAGQSHQRSLIGTPLEHGAVQIGHLPPLTFDFALERLAIPAGCASLLSFSTWVPALIELVQSHRDELLGCDGLIIDLRGNPGGVIASMLPLAAELFVETALLGTLLRRDARLEFRVFPRRVGMAGEPLEPFTGPVAVLIDGMSASTSEFFAAGLQATGRARLFGQHTAGMALPSTVMPLASGDFLMYAFADYQDSSGRRIEGVGVAPDQAVALSADNVLEQPAPSLKSALEWINSQLEASP